MYTDFCRYLLFIVAMFRCTTAGGTKKASLCSQEKRSLTLTSKPLLILTLCKQLPLSQTNPQVPHFLPNLYFSYYIKKHKFIL